MDTEIKAHETGNHWKVVRRAGYNHPPVIKAIWLFLYKRLPIREIEKHKASICAHGGMQQWGEYYLETYAPLVNWLSVRFLLTISLVFDFATRSIDFTQAYQQADLTTDVFM